MGNIETVKKLYELFSSGDKEGISQLFDENIKWNQMKGFPAGGQYTGAMRYLKKYLAD